jgi:serine/threonine protein kinase
VSTGSQSATPPERSAAEQRRSRPPGAPDVFAESDWIGRVIDDRYRVESLLGEGGMGAVFLAEHVKLQKKVALKIILPQFAGNGEVAERFAREAMASAKLEHPHVASALDYGTLSEGGAYLVMQYARGPSLRKSLLTQRGWRYAADVGAQIADALSAAHAAGIVHRDLKPENVVLEPREDGSELVRVLDFGIARVLDPGETSGSVSKLTRVGTIIGTPGYMAPEQALGEPVDTRADLYALGVILWEITAGRELFTETEVTALVTKQLTTEPPRLRSIHPDVPAELEDVVARLLARERADRPQKAGEVRDVLKRIAFAATMERFSQSGTAWPAPSSTASSPGFSIGPASAPTTGSHASLPGLPHAATITGSGVMAAPQGPLTGSQPLMAPHPSLFDAAHPLAGNRRLLAIAAVVASVMGLLLVGLMLLMFSSGPTAQPPITPVTPTTPVHVPQPPGPPGVVPTPTIPTGVEPPPPIAAADLAPIPTTVSADFETLSNDDGRSARRGAADRLLAMPEGAMPRVVRLVAELEAETGCTEKRDRLEELVTLGDARALPALQHLADAPRRGCGFLGTQDCYRCLRTPLRRAIDDLASR